MEQDNELQNVGHCKSKAAVKKMPSLISKFSIFTFEYLMLPGCRILFSTPVQLRKQKYAKEPAQLVLSLKFQSDQHAQMIPYNC